MEANYSRLWLAEAHRRVVDRITTTADRLILQRAQLDLVDASSWPSFVITHQTGLRIPDGLVATYRSELVGVLKQAAEALEQASVAPECSELEAVWHAAVTRLLPTTRMLLIHHAELIELDDDRAVVAVAEQWLPHATGRINAIEQALGEAIGRSVALSLVPAAEEVVA